MSDNRKLRIVKRSGAYGSMLVAQQHRRFWWCLWLFRGWEDCNFYTPDGRAVREFNSVKEAMRALRFIRDGEPIDEVVWLEEGGEV